MISTSLQATGFPSFRLLELWVQDNRELKVHFSRTAIETHAIAAELAIDLQVDDLVLLEGELGAGKTEFAKGVLRALGWSGPVRSPTFPILVPYPTEPPVLHVDLYRIDSVGGLGLEEALEGRVGLIEWPDRASELLTWPRVWRVRLTIEGESRRIEIVEPCA